MGRGGCGHSWNIEIRVCAHGHSHTGQACQGGGTAVTSAGLPSLSPTILLALCYRGQGSHFSDSVYDKWCPTVCAESATGGSAPAARCWAAFFGNSSAVSWMLGWMWVCTYGEAPPLSVRETPAAAGSLVSAVLGVSTVPSEEERQEQQRLMQGASSLVCCDCLPATVSICVSAVAHFLVELTSQHRSSLAAEVVRQLAGGE